MLIHVTAHAVMRYQERVANVSDDEATQALRSPVVERAALFGARFVRLASGHRIVIENCTVVTVLPPMHFRRQVGRVGLPRFGNRARCVRDEGDEL